MNHVNPSVPRLRYGPVRSRLRYSTVWGLGTGPAAVHWPLDEHPQNLGTLGTPHDDLLTAVGFGV